MVSDVVTALTDELHTRLPAAAQEPTMLILENDLIGRAVLALLWHQRSDLRVYLVTSDTDNSSAEAVRSGITTVRHAPHVQVVSNEQAAQLIDEHAALIWALAPHRTAPDVAQSLQNSNADTTFLPYFEPFQALDQQHPDQSVPAHELALRDLIGRHAQFLNFFGDRYNPRDLYERSKYPPWLNPPAGFVAGIPRLACNIYGVQADRIATDDFDGVLRLSVAHMLQGHRATVEFGSLFDIFDNAKHDATLRVRNAYSNQSGSGMLAIEVHHEGKLVTAIDVATSPPEVEVPVARVRRGASLTVSIVALEDNPKISWARATTTSVHLGVHQVGKHSLGRIRKRVRAWLKRVRGRRQRIA